ncbi:MAG: molybdopterin oxidoreductase family protein [Halapricum sp.]
MSDDAASPWTADDGRSDGDQTDVGRSDDGWTEDSRTDDDQSDGDAAATVCPFCSVGCTLTPGEHPRERARGVAGPANPQGHLCPKGIGAFDAVMDDRLTSPLVRRDGELVPTDWETALDHVAAGFSDVRESHGSDGLCFLGAPHSTNETNYLLQKLARALGTNNVDNRSRLCHASAMTALETRLGRPAMTNSLSDLQETEVFLVIGANPADQQPVAFDSHVRPALNDGATLVHVDPRANRTTRAADIHLTPRPDTDALVVRLLCALVRKAGLVEESFVAERTRGYDTYAESLAEVDVESDAALAGLDLGDLREVAQVVGEADRVAVLAATGIDEGDPGQTDTADALVNLLLMTGNLGKPGTGMNVLRGPSNEQGATDAGCRPDRLPGHLSVTDAKARERVADVWGFEPPASPGLDEQQAVELFGEAVHGALVVGENPVVEKRDASWMRERLDALETLVVVDLFESETTDHADVVLPAASGLETAGTVTNLDRRVQSLSPAVEPPVDARSDFAILRALGTRLVGDAFGYADPAEAFAEWTALSPVHDGMTLDAVGDGGIQWPVQGADGRTDSEGTAVLYEEQFETTDGRASFVAVEPDPSVEADGLVLVVGSRAGGFAIEEETDEGVHVDPDDATARDIEDGDAVVVENDAATVRTTAVVDSGVREGTVSMHADVADPLVRGAESTVRVRPA